MTALKPKVVIAPLSAIALAAVPGCAGRELARAEVARSQLREQSILVLRTALRQLEDPRCRWARVHAAEMLLALDLPEGVEEVYRHELAAHEAVPQYRIGIWRVLSRAARQAGRPDPWFPKIVSALIDPNGPDRGHAVETLGKLGLSVPPDARKAARSLMDSPDPAMAAFAAWVVGLDDPSTGREALRRMLTSDNSESRRLAAYALRFQSDLPDEVAGTLIEAALAEPADSPARLHLLSSAFVHAPPGSRKQTIRKAVVHYLQTGTEPQKHEAASAFATAGTREDIPVLEPLLTSSEPDSRIGAAYAVLSLGR